MFGRYAWSPRITMLWSWFGKAVASAKAFSVGNGKPLTRGASLMRARRPVVDEVGRIGVDVEPADDPALPLSVALRAALAA